MPKKAWWKKMGESSSSKGVHTPSTKNIHTLAHLDQGLWLVSPLDPVFDWTKYEKQVCLQILHTYSSTKIAIRDRLRKKGKIKSIGKELYTLNDSRDHPRNFINFFTKPPDWRLNKGVVSGTLQAVLTLNRQRWGWCYKPHRSKVKGANKANFA